MSRKYIEFPCESIAHKCDDCNVTKMIHIPIGFYPLNVMKMCPTCKRPMSQLSPSFIPNTTRSTSTLSLRPEGTYCHKTKQRETRL